MSEYRNRQPLTLLQRGVISRLEQAGLHEIAARAQLVWRNGQRVEQEPAVMAYELRADFAKANAQAEER